MSLARSQFTRGVAKNPDLTDGQNGWMDGRSRLADIGSLAAHLQNAAVRIGVNGFYERGAGRGPILRQEPTGLEPNAAGVTQGFGTQRPSSPLWGSLAPAMQTAPYA